MMTHYYCDECEVGFEEDSLPNINKRHHCGKRLKIVRHEDGEHKKKGE